MITEPFADGSLPAEVTTLPPDEHAYLNDLMSRSAKLRGSIVDMAIFTETIIDQILAEVLCSTDDTRTLLRSLVLSNQGLGWSAKTDILKSIVHLRYRNLMDDDLFKQLSHLRKLRNRLAHSMLDASDEFFRHRHPDKIQVVYLEDGRKKQMVISEQDVRGWLIEFSRVHVKLLRIRDDIAQAASGAAAPAE